MQQKLTETALKIIQSLFMISSTVQQASVCVRPSAKHRDPKATKTWFLPRRIHKIHVYR